MWIGLIDFPVCFGRRGFLIYELIHPTVLDFLFVWYVYGNSLYQYGSNETIQINYP